ncbi:MAG: hypothetical protein H6984_15230 [Pseudomonadales bacterium]|nr:hypothetical protein [Halioglobus sp.]MCP5123804.1 hypothetical protein [Pseudomonadales bacterium]
MGEIHAHHAGLHHLPNGEFHALTPQLTMYEHVTNSSVNAIDYLLQQN